jgi:hypothetical protein
MKPLPFTAANIDVTDWNWGFGELDEPIVKVINEVLRAMLCEYSANEMIDQRAPIISFPWSWALCDSSLPPLTDGPLTLRLRLPLGGSPGDVEEPAWDVGLSELFLDMLQGWSEGYDLKEHPPRMTARSKAHMMQFVEALEAETAKLKQGIIDAVLIDDNDDEIEG